MGDYKQIPKNEEVPSVISVDGVQIESFLLEKDQGVSSSASKFRNCLWAILILAIPMPIAGWFVDEKHVVFIQSWAFFAAQVLLALLGFRALRYDIYKRLSLLKKLIHIYFIALIVALIANMALLTFSVVKHNEDNCGDFDYYQVCKDRWGMMGAQLALIIFYPLIIFIVLLIYRYFLQSTKQLMNTLLQREI